MGETTECTVRIGLVGAGMFGGDIHLRAYADLQRSGIAPHLGRIGLDAWARPLAPARFELAAVATRSRASAERARDRFHAETGHAPRIFWGATPWEDLLGAVPGLDVLAVATPDPLHTPAILAALDHGAHVISEKPLCLRLTEADRILETARRAGAVVAVDMHKRYDPDHLRIRDELCERIGEPLYGVAYLEEPLDVSTRTFQWVRESDPFTYVGSHWVDLLWHYYRSKPASLTAVGQKRRLRRQGIDAYDAVQVRVDYDNGMSVSYHNNWITPADFEGPVNQGHEIVGTDGKVESDQQARGLRYWFAGGGSRTANTHFARDVRGPDGAHGLVGYGADSLYASLAAICRVRLLGETPEAVAGHYPDAEDGRIVVAIVEAARQVRDLNFRYLETGRGAPASARFGPEGITLVDPHRAGEGPDAVFTRIYDRPL